mgnify:FL=1
MVDASTGGGGGVVFWPKRYRLFVDLTFFVRFSGFVDDVHAHTTVRTTGVTTPSFFVEPLDSEHFSTPHYLREEGAANSP